MRRWKEKTLKIEIAHTYVIPDDHPAGGGRSVLFDPRRGVCA